MPLKPLHGAGSDADRHRSGFDTPGRGDRVQHEHRQGRLAVDKWSDSCYSGTVDTAGGIVFVGRNTGHARWLWMP